MQPQQGKQKKLIQGIFLALILPTLASIVANEFEAHVPLAHAAAPQAIDFEADDKQYLAHANDPSFDITGDFTCEAWVKMESTGVQSICSKLSSDRGYYARWRSDGPNPATENYFEVCIGNGVSSCRHIFNVVQAPYVGVWTHIALSYNSASDTFEGFLNGVSIGTSPVFSVTAPTDSPAEFRIGESGVNYADALFDDVRVWNRARTLAEIAADYESELTGTEPGLVHYYKFNGDTADTADPSSPAFEMRGESLPTFSDDGAPELAGDTSALTLEAEKPSDETRIAGTHLQDDADLVLILAPNTSYALVGELYATTDNPAPQLIIGFLGDDPDTKITLQYNAVPVQQNTQREIGQNTSGELTALGTPSDSIFLHPQTVTTISITGTVTTGPVGGVFRLQWAQGKETPKGSKNVQTTFHTGSFLKAKEE